MTPPPSNQSTTRSVRFQGIGNDQEDQEEQGVHRTRSGRAARSRGRDTAQEQEISNIVRNRATRKRKASPQPVAPKKARKVLKQRSPNPRLATRSNSVAGSKKQPPTLKDVKPKSAPPKPSRKAQPQPKKRSTKAGGRSKRPQQTPRKDPESIYLTVDPPSPVSELQSRGSSWYWLPRGW